MPDNMYLGRPFSFWNNLNREFDCDLTLLAKADLMSENIKLRGIIARLSNSIDQMKELLEGQYK